MMRKDDDDDDDFPTTQPVLSLLLRDVVAYVEVRSGHDNRSRGVKTQLRNLGATVMDTLTKDVTHVIFNEGMPSTYKKAKKLNCHLVSVLWIEACKEKLSIVSEAGYPPIGQQIYENPNSLKNFKKMKSMQPDFDDEVAEIKTNRIRKQIQRRCPKAKNKEEVEEESYPKQVLPRKSTRKNKNCKTSEKKSALKEVNSKTVENVVVLGEEQVHEVATSTICAQSVKVVKGNESSGASSSVIICEQVAEAGSSSKVSKKASKFLDNSPISRAEFMEGLSSIVRSLSDQENVKVHEMSPWRKRVGPSAKGIKKIVTSEIMPQRRSPRYNANAMQINNTSKKAKDVTKESMRPPATTSASAVLSRRLKVTPLPSSPGPDFMLLSQEPGDMPSIDELARMRKGSIKAGDDRVTLSQVLKSYNAAAEGQVGSNSSSTSAGPHQPTSISRRSSRCSNADSSILNVEDFSQDAEVISNAQNTCPSEAGSTTSSLSTRVLINGLPQDKTDKMACSADFLPGSEEMDLADINAECNHTSSDGAVEVYEREPSPIFVIKKPKMRRPLKKLTGNHEQSASTSADSSSFTSTTDVDQSGQGEPCSSEKANNTGVASVKQKRESLNPIDYLNKYFLPRFSIMSKTPNNVHCGKVLVEDTPDIVGAPTTKSDLVIPPTPAEHEPLPGEDDVVSPTQSLTNSVVSWVKKSCKVPLFAYNSKKMLKPLIPEEPTDIDAQETPKKEETTVTSNAKSSLEPLSNVLGQTSLTPVPPTTSETVAKLRRTTRKSPQNQQSESITRSTEPHFKTKRGQSKAQVITEMNERAELTSKSATKTRKARSKVKVRVEDNNDAEKPEADIEACIPIQPKPIPAIVVQKLDEAQLSSGYDSSHSHVSKAGSETGRNIPSTSLVASAVKRKKVTDLLSPVIDKTKKRSEIYENDATSPASSNSVAISGAVLNVVGRKRVQSVPTIVKNKRQKLSSMDLKDLSRVTSKRLSRVDSKGLIEARSQSDLSMDSSNSSERMSSREAKKRLARSLTRNLPNDAAKVIVCTFLTASEQNGIEAAGESLEGWKLEEKVTPRTTHVINSGPKRTLNMLKGMSRGCWIVDQNWMLDSSKAGCWLDEEKYELVQFSPAVRLCRMKRQATGKSFKHTLFSKAGPIYVSPKTNGPPAKEIRELLTLCGANLSSVQDAKIVIGEDMSKSKQTVHCVEARWVLDCITKNKILPVSDPAFKLK